MVIILGGLDGSSKSYSSMQWATAGLDDHSRPSIFLDLEYPRAKKLHQVHFSGTTIEIVNCKVIYQKSDEKQGIRRGERDPIKSFELLEKKVIEILDNFEKYGCIVIDGISDIRSDYSKVWLKEYNLREKKNRQTIGKDPGAWADINSRIIEMIVSPMQELGDFYNTRVIMTSMMGDDYKLIKLENGKHMRSPPSSTFSSRKVFTKNRMAAFLQPSSAYSNVPNRSIFLRLRTSSNAPANLRSLVARIIFRS